MLACRFLELASLLFQTCEAEDTEYTRVPDVHPSEEVLRELVKGQCQRQRLYAAAGRPNVDETLRHVIFDARQIRFTADVFVCGMNLRSLHGTERMREFFLCGNWMFPAFWRKFLFEFTVSYFWKYCWSHAPCHLTQMTVAWTWT